jgi:RNA polymerase-binding transcription factor DksA
MTSGELNNYRQRLLALKKRLTRDVSQLRDEGLGGVGGEASGGLSDVPVHPADLGSHEFEQDLTLDLVRNEELLLAEVNAAWERLDRGTFGRCETCGHQIARERLQVLPFARLCATCAQSPQPRT